MFNQLENILSKIVKYGLYAILLTPLVFWPRALYAFMTPKFILFQVLVEIVFAAWLIVLLFRNSNLRIHSNSTNNINSIRMSFVDWDYIKSHWLTLSLLTFFAVSFTSAVFGVDFSRSFWGIGARMTGLFAELHFFAWFLVLVSVATQYNPNLQIYSNSANKTDKIRNILVSFVDLNHYMNFSFFVALAVALSAFYENTAWRLVYGSTVFNNPTFAGPYFIFHFFWGLYQTLPSSLYNSNLRIHSNSTNNISSIRMSFVDLNHYKKWFFGVGAALLAFVIFLGQIRGVMLGILVGLFVLGLGMVFTDTVKRRFKIIIFAFFTIIFIGLAVLWLARESSFVQNKSILKRLTQISLSQTTIQTRFFAWRAASQGFKDYPLLGVGPENYNYVFNAYYNPKLLKYGFGETWFDKPHNAFLEILTETGSIGSLAFLLILLAIVSMLFRLFKSGQKILALIVLSAFIAYLSSIFFSFDSFGSWFGLFLMLGFLASHNNSNLRIHSNSTNKFVEFGYIGRLGLLVVLTVALFLIYLNYSMWRANIADADALRVFSRDSAQGIELFKKSLSYNTPYKAEYQFDLFASVAGAISKNLPLQNLEQNINLILEEGEKAVAAHPNNAAYYTDLVKLYNVLAEKGRDPKIISWSETYGKKSLELSPNRQETLYYLARTALLKDDTKLAVTLTKNTVDAEPSINVSHWYFGLALIADNQKEAGKIEIEKALKLGYKPQNDTERNFVKQLGL